jgi:hypothetical protein
MKKNIKAKIDLKELFKERTYKFVRRIYIWPNDYTEFNKFWELNREIHWFDHNDEPFMFLEETTPRNARFRNRWWFAEDEGSWAVAEDMTPKKWLFCFKKALRHYSIIPVKRLKLVYSYYRKGYQVDWFGWKCPREKED